MDRVSDAALQLAEAWSQRPEYFNKQLDPALVHKKLEENVLVSHVERVPDGAGDEFLISFYVDPAHAFFFEHKLDHVPGLFLVEACRQAAEAVSHLYFDVPVGSIFVLSGLSIQFTRFAELSDPLFVVGRIDNVVRRRGAVTKLEAYSTLLQRGMEVGRLDGGWRIMAPKLYERMADSLRHMDVAGDASSGKRQDRAYVSGQER